MKFNDLFVFCNERFAVGQEKDSQRYYLSIPVSNGLVEYEEYYELSPEEFTRFSRGLDEMRQLAVECRARQEDGRLMMKPGSKRGDPV